jgi:hypothetical protein
MLYIIRCCRISLLAKESFVLRTIIFVVVILCSSRFSDRRRSAQLKETMVVCVDLKVF